MPIHLTNILTLQRWLSCSDTDRSHNSIFGIVRVCHSQGWKESHGFASLESFQVIQFLRIWQHFLGVDCSAKQVYKWQPMGSSRQTSVCQTSVISNGHQALFLVTPMMVLVSLGLQVLPALKWLAGCRQWIWHKNCLFLWSAHLSHWHWLSFEFLIPYRRVVVEVFWRHRIVLSFWVRCLLLNLLPRLHPVE